MLGTLQSFLLQNPSISLLSACFFVFVAVQGRRWFGYRHVSNLKKTISSFEGDYVEHPDSKDTRRDYYAKTTEVFYNLVTEFYEYGWGQSFHFAPRYKDETFAASILRYEHYVAAQLGIPTPWDALDPKAYRVLDVGCGIGGPMRAIARFFKFRVNITGVNITKEHIARATRYNQQLNISNCDFLHCDFNKIPQPDNTFDAIYDFESTLHSTDHLTTFRELFRVLKPGGRVVSAQYCLLDAYDPKNPRHVDIIRRVDNTNGCYVAGRTTAITTANLQRAGFRVLSREDLFTTAAHSDIAFSEVFESSKGQRFTGTTVGLWLTYLFCFLGESLFLLPRGTTQVQGMMMGAAQAFKDAGRENILTPGMLYVLQKPER